ncbi:MAG: ATP-binding cassette domain-containing protein [Eubacterium sp.]|nr:ATP-binding cassette domain-containing protein [Eubacterium sp.]
MNKKSDRNSIKESLIMGLLWFAIWAAASLAAGSDLILPGPVSTVRALAGLVCTGGFWLDVLSTVFRVLAGAFISFTAGSLCAAAASRNKAFRTFLDIPVSFFKSVPVMAVIIYIILVVKADWVAVVVCILMCFPIAYTNMLSGIMGRDRELEELAEVLRLTGKQRWSIIERPELQPEIRSSVTLIMGMSWKVVVASEVLSIPGHSIGYQMLNSKYYLETPDLFAYIIVLLVLSLTAEKLTSYLADLDYRDTGKRVRNELARAISVHSEKKCDKDDPSLPVIVTLDGVTKSYVSDDGVKKTVFSGLDMELMHGVVALLGPSGEGKTTVARLIMGLEKPDEGTVRIEPYMMPDVLFQEDRLLPWLTAEENMMLAFIGQRTGPCGKAEAYDAITEMASRMEISDVLDRKPGELSGGMAHRVAFGRALLGGSRLLILDEPMRGIDAGLKKRLTARLDEYIRHNSRGEERIVIMITHDEKLAEDLADTFIRM